MSTLKVDTINEKTSGNGVTIPGHIIQIVKSEVTGNVQATSATYLDVGHSLVITPKFASSHVLLQHFAQGQQNGLDQSGRCTGHECTGGRCQHSSHCDAADGQLVAQEAGQH